MKNLIHSFEYNGQYYVVDGGSGSIHVCDELAWQVLNRLPGPVSTLSEADREALIQEFADAEVEGILADFLVLEEQGMLWHPGYREIAQQYVSQPTYVKALCLNVSHDCNLRCQYCFAGKGSFGGERMNMSQEVAHKAVDFLLEASGPKTAVEIDFFGGEPLLNMDVVRSTVEYGRAQAAKLGKDISFTITTNGVLLTDEIINYLDREMYNVVLSLDGRREVNDEMRQTVNGRGSAYDLVLQPMLEMAKRRGDKQYYVRGTYTHYNTDFAQDVIHLAQLGFGRISVEPVVTDPEDDYALKPEDVPVLEQQYELLTEAYLQAHREAVPLTSSISTLISMPVPVLPSEWQPVGRDLNIWR